MLCDLSHADHYRLLQGIPADAGLLVKNWMYAGNWQFDLAARRVWNKYYVVEQVTPPLPSPGSLSIKARVGLRLRGYLAHSTVAVSDEVKKRLCETYGYPKRRVHVFPNGANPDRFFFNAEDRATTRVRWGMEPDFVFGVVSRLSPEKRVDRVVRGLHRLVSAADKLPARPRLVVVGNGSEEPALRRLVDELGLGEAVLFVPRTDSPERVYSAIDAFVLTSDFEGLPLALCEAMAAERVVIATDVSGTREVITSADVGCLVPREDPVALADAMRWAMELTPEERRPIGENARRHVVRKFNQQVQLQRVMELVERGFAGARQR
jgi:glycosyltransferase involved in cell wall biosynthesis